MLFQWIFNVIKNLLTLVPLFIVDMRHYLTPCHRKHITIFFIFISIFFFKYIYIYFFYQFQFVFYEPINVIDRNLSSSVYEVLLRVCDHQQVLSIFDLETMEIKKEPYSYEHLKKKIFIIFSFLYEIDTSFFTGFFPKSLHLLFTNKGRLIWFPRI